MNRLEKEAFILDKLEPYGAGSNVAKNLASIGGIIELLHSEELEPNLSQRSELKKSIPASGGHTSFKDYREAMIEYLSTWFRTEDYRFDSMPYTAYEALADFCESKVK